MLTMRAMQLVDGRFAVVEAEVPGMAVLQESLPGSLDAAALALAEDARQRCAPVLHGAKVLANLHCRENDSRGAHCVAFDCAGRETLRLRCCSRTSSTCSCWSASCFHCKHKQQMLSGGLHCRVRSGWERAMKC